MQHYRDKTDHLHDDGGEKEEGKEEIMPRGTLEMLQKVEILVMLAFADVSDGKMYVMVILGVVKMYTLGFWGCYCQDLS